jgi:hypothetical protein
MATRELVLAGIGILLIVALTGGMGESRVDAMRELEQRIDLNQGRTDGEGFAGL